MSDEAVDRCRTMQPCVLPAHIGPCLVCMDCDRLLRRRFPVSGAYLTWPDIEQRHDKAVAVGVAQQEHLGERQQQP